MRDPGQDIESHKTSPRGEGAPIRVGGIDYLNALPLTRYIPQDKRLPLVFCSHTPGELADMLREDRLDLALVPVVEYVARPEYRVVPGICVSSYGEVQSIRLYHRRPLRETRVVGLDVGSRTSSMLTRLLFQEVWGASPRFVKYPARQSAWGPGNAGPSGSTEGSFDAGLAGGEPLDAVLLIGDSALALPSVPGWEVIDLGTGWTRWTGLPFVYAVWLWQGGLCPEGLVECLVEGKSRGVSRVDEIAAGVSMPGGFGPAACRHYLSCRVQYDRGSLQIAGCREFF